MLELETQLQKERERLGELRKKHYELAGVAEGWGEEQEGKATFQYHLTPVDIHSDLVKSLINNQVIV